MIVLVNAIQIESRDFIKTPAKNKNCERPEAYSNRLKIWYIYSIIDTYNLTVFAWMANSYFYIEGVDEVCVILGKIFVYQTMKNI